MGEGGREFCLSLATNYFLIGEPSIREGLYGIQKWGVLLLFSHIREWRCIPWDTGSRHTDWDVRVHKCTIFQQVTGVHGWARSELRRSELRRSELEVLQIKDLFQACHVTGQHLHRIISNN